MNPSFIQLLASPPFILGVLTVFLAWLILITFLYWFALRHYLRLTKEVKGMDLKKVLEAYLSRTGENTEEITQLHELLARTQRDGELHLQRLGLVRFNPFDDTGGDQSFSLALLDGYGSGLVISSLYGRDVTRMYGKPVREGKESGYEFSVEEKEAVTRALQNGGKSLGV